MTGVDPSLANAILDRFTTELGRPIVVADPDGLLRDAAVLAELEERGFDILFLGDPIEFRFAYERLRVAWDGGSCVNLVVVVEDEESEPPHDVADGAERVSLGLADFFPNLSAAVVRELQPADRDALFRVQHQAGRKRLGADETRDFLRRVLPTRPAAPRSGRCAPRLEELLGTAEQSLPRAGSGHAVWRRFARYWAEARASFVEVDDPSPSAREVLRRLEETVDGAFAGWIGKHYGPLASLPAVPPIMLHHVPHRLAQDLRERSRRVALLVLDGLALWQWALLREELRRVLSGLRLDEDAVFAWLPTLTVVSRQALFAARAPLYFPKSIRTTAREPAHWQRFWQEEGLRNTQVAYQKGVEARALAATEGLAANREIRALGLVVNTVDDIVHGMKLGERGMANQVRQWAAEGFLAGLLDTLLAAGFDVWLTSDHGNIEALGIGSPSEGALANLRGERVRIFTDESLRKPVAHRFRDAVPWPPLGLPDDFLPLLAPGRGAFVPEGARVVCHGGAALEEVVVPLVRITRPTL